MNSESTRGSYLTSKTEACEDRCQAGTPPRLLFDGERGDAVGPPGHQTRVARTYICT